MWWYLCRLTVGIDQVCRSLHDTLFITTPWKWLDRSQPNLNIFFNRRGRLLQLCFICVFLGFQYQNMNLAFSTYITLVIGISLNSSKAIEFYHIYIILLQNTVVHMLFRFLNIVIFGFPILKHGLCHMCLYYWKTADDTSLNVIMWFSCPQCSSKLKYDAKF